MPKVRIIGVGMVRFGRILERTQQAMVENVAKLAVKDAGIEVSDIQRIFSGNAADGLMSGQEMIRGEVWLQNTQLAGVPLVNVENACASSSSAANLAFDSIAAGRCEVALVLGVEKLSHEVKTRAFSALQGATDCSSVVASSRDDDQAKNSVFVDVYAQEGRRYMADYGATVEDLAAVAVKNRQHGSLNPLAQYQQPQTIEDVLAARTVVDPLTLPMCSPTTDGAAALVMSSENFAQRTGCSGCEVLAIELAAGAGPDRPPVAAAAKAAYEMASLGPHDLDVLEVHDAAAPAELLQYAEIGLCAPGEGHLLVRSGATSLGGKLPVNVSGGLMSRGHPIGATGAAQLVEIYDQVRGRTHQRQVDNARVGMAVNAGGWLNGTYAVAVATIMRSV